MGKTPVLILVWNSCRSPLFQKSRDSVNLSTTTNKAQMSVIFYLSVEKNIKLFNKNFAQDSQRIFIKYISYILHLLKIFTIFKFNFKLKIKCFLLLFIIF